MKKLKLILSLVIVVTVAVLTFQVVSLSMRTQELKHEYAELNHFKYGLFSINEWKTQVAAIVSDEINSLSLKGGQQEKVIRTSLQNQLVVLIDKIALRIKQHNKKSVKGWFTQSFIDEFIDVNDIKAGVPEYADAILREMQKSKTEGQLKSLIKNKVTQYMEETFDLKDDTTKNQIIARLGVKTEDEAKKLVSETIDRNQHGINVEALAIISLCVLLFVLEGFSKGPLVSSQYILLSLAALLLMISGVTTPMIDMEAKISQLNFMLLDHPIHFENQILYFQSKSVLNVFWLMITHREIQMKLVGVLIVTFSVIFPLLKMLSCLAYYYNYCEARKYRLIKFFVEKSGKWSMADVLVVAMFMAYIGFNGVINSQLSQLGTASQSVQVLTTNGTSLQPGYFLFLTYTLLSMFLSIFIKNRPYNCDLETRGFFKAKV